MTGPRHTRFLIASRMMETLLNRYNNMETTISAGTFETRFTFPGHYVLSESVLTEWCDILSKYQRIHYSVQFKENKWMVCVV